MRIATLQFAPKLGDVLGNIKRASELLERGRMAPLEKLKPDILVLPEMAFTGYNFPSREAIRPYLEPAGQGPSAKWAMEAARRIGCKVCVGYPEIEKSVSSERGYEQEAKLYNSLLVVDENGEMLLNYRKSFLYYTDETWATEGDTARGFLCLPFNEQLSRRINTSFGICMDINPYKFEAPFTAWEFANRVLDSKSQLVILSMAWLTLLSVEELNSLAGKPDIETFKYWIQRFLPLVRQKMGHEVDINGEKHVKKIVIVFANRAGEEPSDGDGLPARYAGTSAVVAVTQRPQAEQSGSDDEGNSGTNAEILCWDLMSATAEGICFADTTQEPDMAFGLAKAPR